MIRAGGVHALENPAHAKPLVESIAASGHRDITVITRGDTMRIWYRPLGFRDEYSGFQDAGARADAFLDSSGCAVRYIEHIHTAWGIPLVSAIVDRNDGVVRFKRRYSASPPDEKTDRQYVRRSLIQFDIPLKAHFGNAGDPLVFRTGVRPGVQIGVRPGFLAYGQIDLYVHNEYDSRQWCNPANIGIAHLLPLHDAAMSVTNIGAFQKELYGIDEEIRVSLSRDRLLLGLHGGVYGALRFRDNRFRYAGMDLYMLVLRAAWSDALYDCTVCLKGGRFLYGDMGFGCEISRVFTECEFGISAVRSGSDTVASLLFRLPIKPGSRKSVASYGVGMAKDFKFSYTFSTVHTGDPKLPVQKALEPELGVSFGEIERLTRPVHFISRSRRTSY